MKPRHIFLPVFVIIATIFMGSCHDMKRKTDLIIYNARIFTNDHIDTTVDCIAIKKGIIYLVGKDAEIRSRYWAKEYINAKKSVVYPGFIDAHSHFTGYAKFLRYANLTNAASFEEVIDILVDFRKTHPDGWLVGRGWDQNKWDVKQFPDNKKLNELFPTTPVVITRVDGHALLANNAAIKAAGINLNDESSQIHKINGVSTGIFLETIADKIRESIPEPSEAEMKILLNTAANLCYAAGLTAVTDAGINKNEVLRLNEMQQNGKLAMHIDVWLNPNEENINYFVKQDIKLSNRALRVKAIKLYADGALGSRGACLKMPYSDASGNVGIQVTSSAELEKICKIAYTYGYQVNTHAIGDSAVGLVLRTYSKFLKPGNDRRWRVEHAQVVAPNDISLFGKFNIIPSIQTTHATSDMPWAKLRLGSKREKYAYAYQDLLKQNSWLANGTDFPIERIDPLFTFYSAVSRKDHYGNPPDGYQMENALTRLQALKSMTCWAAKSAFNEGEVGEIIKGKIASFTILDKDILTIPEKEILDAKVLYTIIDGKIVYKVK